MTNGLLGSHATAASFAIQTDQKTQITSVLQTEKSHTKSREQIEQVPLQVITWPWVAMDARDGERERDEKGVEMEIVENGDWW